MDHIDQEIKQGLIELLQVAQLQPGDLFVIGCSTSEVAGKRVGTSGSLEVASTLFQAIMPLLKQHHIELAVQCCEHLNRSLVIEASVAERLQLEVVNAIPQPHAGGAFATVAYENFSHPVMVESILQKAKAGMDIGGVFIGMHLKSVVIPVRTSVAKIGSAIVLYARTRAKYIGGERAIYLKTLAKSETPKDGSC